MENGQFVYDSGEYLCLAFTIKKLGPREVELSDYTEQLHLWQERFKNSVMIEDFIREHDDHGKLHIHGIIYVKKNFYKKRLQIDGYYVHTTDMYSKEQWFQYMLKSQPGLIRNDQYMF